MTCIEKSGKTVEEAIEYALTELNTTRDHVDVEVLEEPSKGLFGLFGSKPARVKVTLKVINPVDTAKSFLTDIFNAMGIKVLLEKMTSDEYTTFNIRGEDLGVLIGKHGQTLDALQYLTNLAANKDGEQKVKFILDVEDYRKRRSETLSRLALRLADKVKRRGEKVVLEPMSPHERKIIHVALQHDKRVFTYSEGEEPYRKVVIALKK